MGMEIGAHDKCICRANEDAVLVCVLLLPQEGNGVHSDGDYGRKRDEVCEVRVRIAVPSIQRHRALVRDTRLRE